MISLNLHALIFAHSDDGDRCCDKNVIRSSSESVSDRKRMCIVFDSWRSFMDRTEV